MERRIHEIDLLAIPELRSFIRKQIQTSDKLGQVLRLKPRTSHALDVGSMALERIQF